MRKSALHDRTDEYYDRNRYPNDSSDTATYMPDL